MHFANKKPKFKYPSCKFVPKKKMKKSLDVINESKVEETEENQPEKDKGTPDNKKEKMNS